MNLDEVRIRRAYRTGLGMAHGKYMTSRIKCFDNVFEYPVILGVFS